MKRLHVNLSTANLEDSIAFYTHLFACEPTVVKPDYAKWMLDDPRVNFSLSTHADGAGVDHLGIQAEDATEFAELRARLSAAENPVFEQPEVTCCYAQSAKAWVRDPNGVAWETFITHGASEVFGDGTSDRAAIDAANSLPLGKCCA